MPISTNVVVDLAIKAVNICCVVGYGIYTGNITSPVSALSACEQHILHLCSFKTPTLFVNF